MCVLANLESLVFGLEIIICHARRRGAVEDDDQATEAPVSLWTVGCRARTYVDVLPEGLALNWPRH